MYLDGLDALDQKIIQLLIENARISYSDIGEKTGISRVAVKARIQALEKKGVIEEYTTIINPQKINGAVSCYFEIETKPGHLPQVTDILYKYKDIGAKAPTMMPTDCSVLCTPTILPIIRISWD